MFNSLIDQLADNLSPVLLGKLVLGVGLALLLLAGALTIQTFRLDSEQSAHRATRAELTGKLVLEQTANGLLRLSLQQSGQGSAALQEQVKAGHQREAKREEAAAERAALEAAAVPTQAEGLGTYVLDIPSSNRAVEYINKRLRGFNRGQ